MAPPEITNASRWDPGSHSMPRRMYCSTAAQVPRKRAKKENVSNTVG